MFSQEYGGRHEGVQRRTLAHYRTCQLVAEIKSGKLRAKLRNVYFYFYNNNTNDNNKCNRTLIVGPSFCGKTYLLLNKLRLIRLEDPEKQIGVTTRSPEHYEDIDIGGASQGIEVEENVGDLEEYRGCFVVFDDMLDSNQKLIDPFFTRGRHKLCDV